MADEPLLDLRTVTGRFHVRIDGAPHFIAHPDALTLYQTAQLEQMGPRVNELMIAVTTGGEFSDADETELDALLKRAVRIVLDAPDVVHGILTQSHRIQILTAFMRLRHENSRTVGAPKTASPQTGAKRSRDSKGSTVALQKAG